MKNKKIARLAACAAAAALCLGVLAGCSSGGSSDGASGGADAASGDYALVNDGTLTVISSLDFPPFENLEGDAAVGFEIDIVKEIGNRLGLSVDIQNQKFDTIVPAIAAGGTADVGVSGITITPEREEEVLFTTPVIDVNQAVCVMGDSGVTSVDQLANATIAAQSGTTGSDWAKENIPTATVVDFDEVTACFAALASGQADAVSMDLPVVASYINTSYPEATIIQETPTGEQYGMIVSKDNPALQAAINGALADMKADGTYDALYDSWFATN